MKRVVFAAVMCSIASALSSQETVSPGTTMLGTVTSDGGPSSLQGTIKYQVPLNDNFRSEIDPITNRAWVFDYTPDVFLNFSDGPQFNSIVVRLTGNYLRFASDQLDDGRIRANTSFIHVFPVAFGLETDQSFDNASLVAEVGYVPFRLSADQTQAFQLGVNPKIGVFAQAGYKFGVSDESDEGAGADQSSEDSDSEIARLKISSAINAPLLGENGLFSSSVPIELTALASADAWYDLINDETYHRAELTLRLGLGEDRDLDFKYENGSGAPNFNEGDQFGVFLTTSF